MSGNIMRIGMSIILVLAMFVNATRADHALRFGRAMQAAAVQLITVVAEWNRAKTGPSTGRRVDAARQTTPPTVVAVGGSLDTERPGFEPGIRV
jgi:hypothetical protein